MPRLGYADPVHTILQYATDCRQVRCAINQGVHEVTAIQCIRTLKNELTQVAGKTAECMRAGCCWNTFAHSMSQLQKHLIDRDDIS